MHLGNELIQTETPSMSAGGIQTALKLWLKLWLLEIWTRHWVENTGNDDDI